MSDSFSRLTPCLLIVALVACFAGCATVPPDVNDEVNAGPFYAPQNVFAAKGLPAELRRVVLLPVSGRNLASDEVAASLDAALLSGLVQGQRFEVTTLGRNECRALFGRTEFGPSTQLPAGFLDDLKKRTGADGVLFVELTNLKVYQPQSLGFRAKLASCSDGTVFWSFDEILSASAASVRNSARREYFQQEHGNRPYDFSQAGLQSPSWFAAFVARQMFGTLPPR